MTEYSTRMVGGRTYVFHGKMPIGYLAKEYPPTTRTRTGVSTRTDQWTGRWIATAHCDGEIGPVTSIAEGLLMVVRVTELGNVSNDTEADATGG